LAQSVHKLLIDEIFEDHIVGHVCRDSTAIEAVERPPSRKKGEKRKRKKPSGRLDRQLDGMTIDEMVADLPSKAAWGTKVNPRGHKYFWPGYKLHIDWADCGIPLSGLLTSASLHDSQVGVPLAEITARRVTSLYDLMDCAYDSEQIRAHSKSLGHVPIIDMVRRGKFDDRQRLSPSQVKSNNL
jgi:hypothetical protein